MRATRAFAPRRDEMQQVPIDDLQAQPGPIPQRGASEDSHIARASLDRGDVDDDIDTIYSFNPAELVEGNSPHHLDLPAEGVELHGSSSDESS